MDDRSRLALAANYLRHLLVDEPAYRRQWVSRARRSGGSPNVTAVSTVLVEYRWHHDFLFDDEAPASQRAYKDRVARALSARSFTPATAALFAAAFRMRPEHAERLIELTTSDSSAPISPSWPSAGPRTHQPLRTVSIHELHSVGPDRCPLEHRTIHAVQALADGDDAYLYVFDTPHVGVRAVQGASAGVVEPFPDRSDLWMCRLSFPRALMDGEFQYFEYVTTFDYPEPPAAEVRRGSAYRLHTLTIRVSFSPEAVPVRLHECEWAGLDSAPEVIRELELDEELSAHLFYERVSPGRIRGISWEWE